MSNEEKKFDDELISFTSSEIVLGCIIPFVLFWGGMLAPFFSDNIYVWVLALIPYYGFSFVSLYFVKKSVAAIFSFSMLMCFFTSILLLVLLFFIPENLECLKNVCRLGILNILPSILGFIFAILNAFINKEDSWVLFPLMWW